MPQPHAPPPSVRAANIEDVAVIVPLVESAYRGDESRRGWTTEADLLDGQRTDAREVSALLRDPCARILIAEVGGVVAGSVLVRREAETGYIGMLAVRPDQQAGGIGALLLAAAERRIAAEWKLGRARMTVIRQRLELIRWYERHGYVDTGRREAFPYGEERFGKPRRPDLEFTVLEKALSADSSGCGVV